MTAPSEPSVEQESDEPRRSAVYGVIVTHHGAGEMLQRCLDSTSRGFEHVVVVDNSGRPVDELSVSGELIETIRVRNDGFGAAVNEGVKKLRESFGHDNERLIAVLNDDVEAETDWLDPLVGAFDSDPSIGAVQPKLLLAGTDPAQVNSVGVELDSAGAGTDAGFGELDGPEWEATRSIDIFTGGAVVFRAEFLRDMEGFDERYFLYYEDVDLALRGAERGWRYLCEPKSVVWHAPGSTTTAMGDDRRYLQERNRIWVAGRFGSAADLGRSLWLAIRRVRHAPHSVHAKALAAGLAGLPRSFVVRRRSRRSS
jgi:N-acetylglucosaminyl-diphospho-decaprenol L-rhamnosyltransferase